MIVGYARTSTVGQIAGFEAQLKELQTTGWEKIFREQVSSIVVRAHLQAALKFIREGDVLVVTKVDRLACSVMELMAISQAMDQKQAGMRILKSGNGHPNADRQADAHRARQYCAVRAGNVVRAGNDVGTAARKHRERPGRRQISGSEAR